MRIVYQRKEALRHLVCLALGLLLFLSGLFLLYQEARRLLPDSIEFTVNGFSSSNLTAARDACPLLTISAYQEENGFVERDQGSGMTMPAKLRYVDGAYFTVTNMPFAAGGLDSAATSIETAQTVIISETLAQEYYFTNQAIGQMLWLNGQPHTVMAVYREPRSLLHRISGDGSNTIYLLQSSTRADTTHILIQEKSGGAVSENELHQLNAVLNGALFRGVRHEDLELRQRLELLFRCYLFLIALVLAMFLTRIAFRTFEQFSMWRKAKKYEDVSRKELLHRLYLPVLCLIVAVGVLVLARFPLIIPAEYLPMDGRLLNLSHYVEVFIECAAQRNTAVYRYADAVYRYAVWEIHLLGIAAAGTLSALLCDLRHLTGSKEDI